MDDAYAGGDGQAPKVNHRHFHREAVEEIAGRLLTAVHKGERLDKRNERRFVATGYQKSWAFMLLSYCRRHHQSIPPRTMDLTFSAIGLTSLLPSAHLLDDLGLTSDIENPENAAKAAELDGCADAIGKSWSENALAKKLGVSRPSIKRWRERDDYKRARAYHCEHQAELIAISGELDTDSE